MSIRISKIKLKKGSHEILMHDWKMLSASKVKQDQNRLLQDREQDQLSHRMMRWNLTSKKPTTETEYEVWKLLSCSFTYHSQKNPFP